MKQDKQKTTKPKKQRKSAQLPPKVAATLSVAVAVVALATLYVTVLQRESEYLWKVQELNLFLDTPLYFRQQMVVAGGMLTYVGTYFTQFFYHPWLGMAMLVGWWALLMVVAARAFHVSARWAVVLLVPVALLFISDFDLGYWIYYLKLRGYFFVATIGLTVATAAVWLYRTLPSKLWLRVAYIVVATALLYPLLGCYGLVASALMAIVTWRLQPSAVPHRLTVSAVAVAAILIVPLLYYRYVYYQTNVDDIYCVALPLFQLVDVYKAYYWPYWLLAACFAIMAVTYNVKLAPVARHTAFWLTAHVVLVAALVWGINRYWYRDYNFHKELRMMQCMEQCDWDTLLQEAANQQEEPTRAIVMMKNLALFRQGRQGDEMYHYLTGAKACATPIHVNMIQVIGRSIYYNYGQLNFCYRWCLEDGVEYGWRAEYLKYLTRCALLNGEWQVARKYINLLKHTRYHRQWAQQQEQFVGNEKALREHADYNQIFHLMNYDNKLMSDQSMLEYYLMNQYMGIESDDPVLQEQTLLAALWQKDIASFWPRFFHYARLHTQTRMPKHYQEAAYLYGHLEHQVDISRMPFDKDVVESYDAFMALAQRCQGMTEEQMRPIFYPRFGHTFYYEYFLIRNQKLY